MSAMNQTLKGLALGFFLSLLFSSAYTQVSDMNLWTRVAAKYDVSKTTRLAVEQEFRFFENASQLEESHTEMGITHEISKRFEGGVFYRFIYEPDPKRFYSIGHRGWVHAEYRLIDKDIRLSIRDRLQTTFKDVFSSSSGKTPEWYNRYKIGIEYQPKKATWIPSASAELWQFLNSGTVPYFDKMRISTGIEYRPNKQFRWELFYSLQQEINVKNPETDHILGVTCTYMIN